MLFIWEVLLKIIIITLFRSRWRLDRAGLPPSSSWPQLQLRRSVTWSSKPSKKTTSTQSRRNASCRWVSPMKTTKILRKSWRLKRPKRSKSPSKATSWWPVTWEGFAQSCERRSYDDNKKCLSNWKENFFRKDIFVQILNDRHGEVTLAIITCIISLNDNFKYLQKRNIYSVKIWTLVYELLHFSVTSL